MVGFTLEAQIVLPRNSAKLTLINEPSVWLKKTGVYLPSLGNHPNGH